MFINTGRKKANIVMGLREIEKTSKIKKKKKTQKLRVKEDTKDMEQEVIGDPA